MNLIEKAARASHEFFRPIYKLPPWEEIPKDAQSMALQHAKAVLSAIREPTMGMISVGDDMVQDRVEMSSSGPDRPTPHRINYEEIVDTVASAVNAWLGDDGDGTPELASEFAARIVDYVLAPHKGIREPPLDED